MVKGHSDAPTCYICVHLSEVSVTFVYEGSRGWHAAGEAVSSPLHSPLTPPRDPAG